MGCDLIVGILMGKKGLKPNWKAAKKALLEIPDKDLVLEILSTVHGEDDPDMAEEYELTADSARASVEKAENDIADKYLLLSNSHDGTSSVQIKFTPIRVVCNNTLTMALKTGPTIRVSHTRELKERLEKARRALKLVNTHYEHIENVFKKMVTIKIDEARLQVYLRLVFPNPGDPEDHKALERVEKDRTSAARLFESGLGNSAKPIAGTLWAAYNGITELVDHTSKGRARIDHLEQIWFGDGYYLKARAFEIAKTQVNEWPPQN